MALAELNLNELAEVISISDKELEMRLLSMGCLPGDRVRIERRSLFGDPLLIRTGNTLFSIRKADASKIIVRNL